MPKKHSVKISVVNQELRYDLNKETTIAENLELQDNLLYQLGDPVGRDE